jgi:hypothetical protein
MSSYHNSGYSDETQPILVEVTKSDTKKQQAQQRDHPEHSPYDVTGYTHHYPSPPRKELNSGEGSKVRTVTPEEKNKLNLNTEKSKK